jgi:RNA polymerase sigma factor (sigma-70 family)
VQHWLGQSCYLTFYTVFLNEVKKLKITVFVIQWLEIVKIHIKVCLVLSMANYCEDNANIRNAMDVFNCHSNFIYAIFRSKVNNDGLAEDLFQDFFVKLACKPLPENLHNIKSYLYKSITNSIYDSIRRVESYKNSLEKYRENLNFSIKDLPVSSVYYDKSTELFEKGVRLLTKAERIVFELMYKDGLSLDDISAKTGLKKDTVSRYISISIKKIRDNIESNV